MDFGPNMVFNCEGKDMKTKYKFIHFEERSDELFKNNSVRKVFIIRNNKSNSNLGSIEWCAPWNRYCFIPNEVAIFDASCLADIQHFIGQLKEGKP